MTVLFVCSGNTCRSPMAEAFARETFLINGIDADARSAGTDAFEDEPASRYAVEAAGEAGLDITGHRSRRVTSAIIEEAAVVLTMTRSHRDILHTLYAGHAGKIYSLSEYSGGGSDITDPFGGGQAVYRRSARAIKKRLDECVNRLRDELSAARRD